MDADHATSRTDAKSVSGCWSWLEGPNTYAPLDWFARSQTVTARSTGEAEVVAADQATFGIAYPWIILLEGLLQREIEWYASGDSSSMITGIEKGYSKKLAYLPKWQRVFLAALKAAYFPIPDDDEKTLNDVHRLCKIGTDDNRADLLTKGLDHSAHWRHMLNMGMVVIPLAW